MLRRGDIDVEEFVLKDVGRMGGDWGFRARGTIH